MKRVSCLLICCLFLLTSCSWEKQKDVLEIASGSNPDTVLVSIQKEDAVIQMLDMFNYYQDFNGSVTLEKSDYIVRIGPIDTEATIADYKIWIDGDRFIFLSPPIMDTPQRLFASDSPAEEFTTLLETNLQSITAKK